MPESISRLWRLRLSLLDSGLCDEADELTNAILAVEAELES